MVEEQDFSADNLDEFIAAEQQRILQDVDYDPIARVQMVYQLWSHWADFTLLIIDPSFDAIIPPKILLPEPVGNDELEFVYPIRDFGYKMSTSKAEDMFTSGMSMCKLYYTIEKMITLLIERLKEGGTGTETEVQVAFAGHELAMRKAFESIINLTYNVVVTNFDPGSWGQRYLETVKRIGNLGYGYPSVTPRMPYRQSRSSGPIKPGRSG